MIRIVIRIALAALLAVAAFAPGALRAEDAKYLPQDEVRSAHVAYLDAQKATGAASAAYRAAKNPETMAAFSAAREASSAARKTWVEAFVASDWDAWDRVADATLLEQGLAGAASSRMKESPQDSVRAYEALLAWLPKSRSARSARTRLPQALVAAGRADEALATSRELRAEMTSDTANMLIYEGDLQASAGDLDAAKQTYDAAVALVEGSEDRSAQRALGYARLRAELIGKPAPDIDSSTWVGGEAKPLSAHTGSVVLLDFWATWCGPCRAVMPAIDDLYRARKDDGLEVLGVTRFYANGYMPASREPGKGESVRDMTEETYLPHLEQFKQRMDIAYPFVVGEKADFSNYFVRGIPTLVVVDRAGKVAFVKVGSGDETLLRTAVERLLEPAE